MIDLLLLLLLGGVTFLVANERAWGAAITLISCLLAGLFAMNYFEPLAAFLGQNVLTSYQWQHCWDIIALLGLFAGGVSLLRVLGDKLMPTYAEVHPLVYEGARWGCGLATGYVVVAIVLTSLHVAPLSREFLGFAPERRNFFGLAPDIQWLAFTQYVSEHNLATTQLDGQPHIFDGAVFESLPPDASTRQVWSSFPIRYAARRQLYASGTAAGTAAPAGGTVAPPPGGAAIPGSGGGGGPSGTGGF
ncbi:CvpA family protein [Planctomicrobium sp. SH664]|uniref:CvpA family protein n=1 Tax=Planctomicrobium sp. SH664 TaxID=3448125 RepID=UPI003F5BB661